MKFDINEMRKLAGLPLVERYRDEDDDDELNQAEKDLIKKADTDLAKKGTKVDDFDPDEEKPAAKKAEKPAPKKEEKAAKEEKPAAEKKERKPRAENPNKKASQVRAHLAANPDMTRGQFIAYVMSNLGMSKAGANTYFYKHKAKKAVAAEGFILVHPNASSFVLAENKMMNQYQWVDGSSELEPLVFETEEEAKKVAKYMTDYKFQKPIIESFGVDEDEE